MAGGHVDRNVLSSHYQNPGDVYQDGATEAAFEVVAQQVDDNYDVIADVASDMGSHKNAAVLDHPDKSVVRMKIADKAIGPVQVDDAAIGQNHHQDNGVPSRALPDNVILQRHMSDNSVGSTELQASAVQKQHIAPGTVGSQHIDAALLASAASLSTQSEFDNRGVNVSKFGAKLDGIADDAPAFNAAIASFPASGGEIVFKGTPKIKSSIIIDKPIILRGYGIISNTGVGVFSASHIIKDGNFDGIILLTSAGGSQLIDFTITGADGNGGNGITIKSGRTKLSNINSSGHGGHGVRIGDNTGANCNLWRIDNLIVLGNSGNGLHVEDGFNPTMPNTNVGYLLGFDARSNLGDGLCLKGSYSNSLYNIHSANNSGYGVRFGDYATGNFAVCIYAENNTTGEMKFDALSTNNWIFGGRQGPAVDGFIPGGTNNFIMGSRNNIPWIQARMDSEQLGIKQHGITGAWVFNQDGANRDLILQMLETSNSANFELKHGGGGTVNWKVPSYQVNGGPKITNHLSFLGSLDVQSVPAQSTKEITVTITGAKMNDTVIASPNGVPEAGITWTAYVSAANTVKLRVSNVTTAAIPVTFMGWRIDVWSHI